MSFSIVLQKNNSEDERVTKSITDIITLSGTLKNSTSIVDPVIVVETDLTTLTGCNYMTISAFGRSYFVRDIVSIRNGLVEIHAHCDVLSSFATQIKSNSAIIQKQQNKWNLYLDDGTFQVYQNPNVLTKQFPSGFSTMEFVLAVAGSSS